MSDITDSTAESLMHCTLSLTVCKCTLFQRASFNSTTDSFSWGHDPYTLACKARPSSDRCWTSLSVSLSLSLSVFGHVLGAIEAPDSIWQGRTIAAIFLLMLPGAKEVQYWNRREEHLMNVDSREAVVAAPEASSTTRSHRPAEATLVVTTPDASSTTCLHRKDAVMTDRRRGR